MPKVFVLFSMSQSLVSVSAGNLGLDFSIFFLGVSVDKV